MEKKQSDKIKELLFAKENFKIKTKNGIHDSEYIGNDCIFKTSEIHTETFHLDKLRKNSILYDIGILEVIEL